MPPTPGARSEATAAPWCNDEPTRRQSVAAPTLNRRVPLRAIADLKKGSGLRQPPRQYCAEPVVLSRTAALNRGLFRVVDAQIYECVSTTTFHPLGLGTDENTAMLRRVA
jgi:hypothetical protein